VLVPEVPHSFREHRRLTKGGGVGGGGGGVAGRPAEAGDARAGCCTAVAEHFEAFPADANIETIGTGTADENDDVSAVDLRTAGDGSALCTSFRP
jgi:hypothetical protein